VDEDGAGAELEELSGILIRADAGVELKGSLGGQFQVGIGDVQQAEVILGGGRGDKSSESEGERPESHMLQNHDNTIADDVLRG
jgi:hypothetical protein